MSWRVEIFTVYSVSSADVRNEILFAASSLLLNTKNCKHAPQTNYDEVLSAAISIVVITSD